MSSNNYDHKDKKAGDGLAITDWNDLSSAVAGSSGLTLAHERDDKVGIGTKNPGQKLVVDGVWNAEKHTGNRMSYAGNFAIRSDKPQIDFIDTDAEQTNWAIHVAGSKLHFIRDSWEDSDLVLDGAGKVGIGTKSPTQKLEVAGNVQATRFIGDGSKLTNLSVGLTGLNLATQSDSKVGIGTTAPKDPLDVAGTVRILTDSNPIRFTSTWSRFPDSVKNQAEISNDISNYKTLMIVGNRSAGDDRRVSVWDRLGIGTKNTEQAKLVVHGGGREFVSPGANGQLRSDGAKKNSNDVTKRSLSIHASASIAAPDYIAFSDVRIKNSQGRSDGSADLATLSRIEITDYTYKDVIAKGRGPHKKVIAQQVETVYPQAVTKNTEAVPDIYEKASVKDGWVELATDLKVGERVRLIGEKEDGIHEVLEVRDGAFRTADQPATEELFVYGREVDDFSHVDYDAISMLNVSATQELARKLEAKDAELARLTVRLAALEDRDLVREARLARLENALSEHPEHCAS